MAYTVIKPNDINSIKSEIANPNYEIKLFLNPAKVINLREECIDELVRDFDLSSKITEMTIQYIENKELDLNRKGWVCRIRRKETDETIDLTYKKRYKIQNKDILSALVEAETDGFDISEDDYVAQIDWGLEKLTLSFSNKKKIKKFNNGNMNLPNEQESINLAIKKIPGKMLRWVYEGWGIDIFKEARIYGPVKAKKYVGNWNDTKVNLEQWKIINEQKTGYEYLVELSFKEKDYETSYRKRQMLLELLNNKQWLLSNDALKTQIVFERYKNALK